jgi:segregation and condensation protein B
VERRIRAGRAEVARIDLARGEAAPGLARAVRLAEALIFAAPAPLPPADLAARLPEGTDLDAVLAALARRHEGGGIVLAKVAGGYAFRTAPDLAAFMAGAPEPRKLSRAALETLAIVAYHQPVTRAEIEEVRGVSTSKGSLDVLLESGWVRLRGRRKTPGRPVTYGTTPAFLEHFGLDVIADLPGVEELRGSGFLEGGAHLAIPSPSDDSALTEDEEPLAEDDPGEAG